MDHTFMKATIPLPYLCTQCCRPVLGVEKTACVRGQMQRALLIVPCPEERKLLLANLTTVQTVDSH